MNTKMRRNLMSFVTALMLMALVAVFGMPLQAKAETKVHTAHTGSDTDGSKHEGWTPIGTAEDLYNLAKTGGKGYLTKNIAIEMMHISGNKEVNLCLNGYSLEGGLDCKINTIELREGAELNLYDESKNTGEITNNNEDCILIHLVEDSEVTMNGGTVGNSNGWGVEIYDGSFTLNDGNVSGNSGLSSCGVRIISGNFTMNGGNISNNTTFGGVYVDGGTFTMNGGAITDNTAAFDGGGVYVDGGTFTMNGGAVTDNDATDNGGGVCVRGGTFTINAGSIGNNAANNGGGVCVSGGTFTINAGSIENNTAEYCGGGVYVSGDGICKIYSGSIGNNTAYQGGGVCVDDGTFTISGGEVAENKSNYGGGVNVLTGNIIMNEGASKIILRRGMLAEYMLMMELL